MVASADRARQKAEARRLRILAKANERLDVVSGLVPPSSPGKVLDDDAVVVVESPSDSSRKEVPVRVASSATSLSSSLAKSLAAGDEKENSGSRRMAAMRRRRAQQRAAKDEEGKADAVEGGDATIIKSSAVEESAEAPPSDSLDNNTVKAQECSAPIKSDGDSNTSPIKETGSISNTTTTTTADNRQHEPKKSYMGVAKMRRKILKQQKAERLQSITDSEALHSDDHMERELVAEMAAMGVTAKMVREGVDVCEVSPIGGAVGMGKKKKKRGWLALLLPSMHTFSRLSTLVVLFGMGFRIGFEAHSIGVERKLVSRGSADGESRIYHVESTLTKPWEYGMGGKVAYLVGKMPSSPPTALPTGFNEDSSCVANYKVGEPEKCTSNQKKKEKQKKKDNQLNQDHKIHIIDMEDEFDSGRAHTRPRGVSTEFDDDIPRKTPNIDPLFRADLDDLLSKSSLPFPIDHAARFAIGFHRTWVYYLWTLPLSVIKIITSTPKNVLQGWIRYPPVVLVFTLLVRLGNRVLLGGGKKLEEDGAKDKGKGGIDVMAKVMESVKSYIEGSFPWLVFVLGTLYDVVKIDMYVVFCGLLFGLVVPLYDLGWTLVVRDGKVLGDGEL